MDLEGGGGEGLILKTLPSSCSPSRLFAGTRVAPEDWLSPPSVPACLSPAERVAVSGVQSVRGGGGGEAEGEGERRERGGEGEGERGESGDALNN